MPLPILDIGKDSHTDNVSQSNTQVLPDYAIHFDILHVDSIVRDNDADSLSPPSFT